MLLVRYRHCFSVEKIQPVWSRLKNILLDFQFKDDPHRISMASIIMGDREHDHCIFIRASAFMWSTSWSCIGTNEHLTDPRDYLCCVCGTYIASQVRKYSKCVRDGKAFSSNIRSGMILTRSAWPVSQCVLMLTIIALLSEPLRSSVFKMMMLRGNWSATL